MHFNGSSPLWVVTSYFNPCKYRKRLDNFKSFRRHLNAPLLLVELEKSGRFELSSKDADIVLHLQGEDCLWQKERLINLGIAALPSHVKFVAWIDCDLIFENENWVEQTVRKLERGAGMVQLFSSIMHQSKQQSQDNILENHAPSNVMHEIGMAKYLIGGGELRIDSVGRFSPDSDEVMHEIRPAPGHAWAAPIDRQTSRQVYDAHILGGADRVEVEACFNRIEEYGNFRQLTDAHDRHLQKWAASRQARHLDYIEGRIFHLWHGDFTNRQYRERHEILVRNNFDPDRDIQLAPNGTWRWTDADSQLAREVAEYFRDRREDG